MTPEKVVPQPTSTADSLEQLEFAKVVKLVVAKTQTPYGRTLAGALRPFSQRARIEEALREAQEARQLLQDEGPLALGSGNDLLPHLERLQTEGLRLDAEVLRDVQAALEASQACRQKLLKSEVCPTLRSFAQQLTPLPELAAEIRRSIGPRAIRHLLSWPICERASAGNEVGSNVSWTDCCRTTACRESSRKR